MDIPDEHDVRGETNSGRTIIDQKPNNPNTDEPIYIVCAVDLSGDKALPYVTWLYVGDHDNYVGGYYSGDYCVTLQDVAESFNNRGHK